jgi:molybdenum cofactor cytidylyltransferase
MKRISVHCLLLCAGKGQRMRPHNKLFLPLSESTVLQKVVEQIKKSDFDSFTAVTGFESEKTSDTLSHLGFSSVHNPLFESGMHSSIKAGLLSLTKSDGFFAVCLADQPMITATHYNQLIHAARKNPEAKLIIPYFEKQRGNPVLISLELRKQILNHPDDDRGCFYLFADYPDECVSVQMNDSSILIDLDTPEDYKCLATSINL